MLARRRGRDRRVPVGHKVWAERFAQQYGFDWLVAPSVNVTLGTSPYISVLGDASPGGLADATDDGNPPALIPEDLDFGGQARVSNLDEFLSADDLQDNIEGLADGSLVLVARALATENGVLFGSSALQVSVAAGVLTVTVGAYTVPTTAAAVDGDVHTWQLDVTGSTGVTIYRDGVDISDTPSGSMPATLPVGTGLDIGQDTAGSNPATFDWSLFAWRDTKLTSGERAAVTAELAARFADMSTSAPAGWETTHAATYGLAALYTADDWSVLQAADDYVERVASRGTADAPAKRIAGVAPPTRVDSVAALGGRPGLYFNNLHDVLDVSGVAALLSGATEATFELVASLPSVAGAGYYLGCDLLDLALRITDTGQLGVYIGSQGNNYTVPMPRVVIVYRASETGSDRIRVYQQGAELSRLVGGAIPAAIPTLTTGILGAYSASVAPLKGVYIAHFSVSTTVPADAAAAQAQSAALYARYS